MWIVVEEDGCVLASKCPVKRQKIESYSACGPCCGTVISGYASCRSRISSGRRESYVFLNAAEGVEDQLYAARDTQLVENANQIIPNRVFRQVWPVYADFKKEGLIADYKMWLNDTTDHPGNWDVAVGILFPNRSSKNLNAFPGLAYGTQSIIFPLSVVRRLYLEISDLPMSQAE